MRWSLDEAREREPSLRLAAALFRFFEVSGRPREGIQWIEWALAVDGEASSGAIADALFGLAMLRFDQADLVPAREAIEECVRLRRDVDDLAGVARALNLYSLVLHYLGDVDRAYEVQEESLAHSRELSLDASVNQGIFHLGMLATARGDFDLAAKHLEDSAARWRAAGNRLAAVGAVLNLCDVERVRGNLDRASRLIDECLEVGRSLDAKALVASSCTFKGYALGVSGDSAGARRFFEEAAALHRETGNKGGLVEVVENAAFVASDRGNTTLAARLLAASTAAREAIGFARDPSGEAEARNLLASARPILGDEAADAAETAGRALGLDRAVAEALDGLV
jgi:tetratricopeptide (TPR) repeat protein